MASSELAPDVERVTQESLSWPERASALAIIDDASYLRGAELLKGIKALRVEVDEAFDPIVQAAFRAHRTACDQKRKAEAPLAEAERVIKARMVEWDDAQERARKAEQRRLEAEARRQEEESRLNLAAEMEREGKAFGDEALVREAHDLIEQPIVPVVAPVPKATPQVSGQHFTTTWSAQVTNLLELVRFVAAHPSHVGLLQANVPALNAQARSLKEHLAIPGVRAIPTKTVASRR